MKKLITIFCLLLGVFIFTQPVSAQNSQSAAGFRGQSLSGATGLFSIPSGRLGWEKPNTFAMDFGFRTIINNDMGTTYIPAITMSLFGWVEISSAFDFQPNINNWGTKNDPINYDFLLGLKIKLPTNASTSIAIGTNFQFLNIGKGDDYNLDYNAYQPYIAITYPGTFFKMPAETTIVFGKTFYSIESNPRPNNSDIDFGMGFDIILFPSAFKNLLHWIIDFSNFSYSDNAWPNTSYLHTSSVWRGILNTGFRIDLSSIPELNRFKFLVDVIFNDLFDEGNRSFTIGAVFGFAAK